MKINIAFLFTVLGICFLHGQDQESLSAEFIEKTLRNTGELFSKNYVFPEKGKKVKTYFENQIGTEKYSVINNLDSLTSQMKKDIFTLLNDRHVNFIIKDKKQPQVEENPEDPMLNFFKSLDNYGLTKVEEIGEGIGFLEITFFFPLQIDEKAKEAAAKVMNSFHGCHSIIFDLRKCKGGSPEMLNYLISYLYPKSKKVHLNDFYFRPTEVTESTYTLDSVIGKRMPDIDVFVLTSGQTFSCGEEFAYDIKHLKRGKIVGETTGGAAHPVQPMNIDEQLQVLIPTGRAINPITKTNWEAVGVVPHVKVGADKALEKTLQLINQNKNQQG